MTCSKSFYIFRNCVGTSTSFFPSCHTAKINSTNKRSECLSRLQRNLHYLSSAPCSAQSTSNLLNFLKSSLVIFVCIRRATDVNFRMLRWDTFPICGLTQRKIHAPLLIKLQKNCAKAFSKRSNHLPLSAELKAVWHLFCALCEIQCWRGPADLRKLLDMLRLIRASNPTAVK